MRAWRICKTSRATDLSGIGAGIEGGRWNEQQVDAVYMGLSPAICVLETFVHQNGPPLIPMTITEWALPEDEDLYWEPNQAELPVGWNALPADTPSMSFGTQWLRQGGQLGLIVPSAVMPLERNIVLNPRHPAIKQVVVTRQDTFVYDTRMFTLKK